MNKKIFTFLIAFLTLLGVSVNSIAEGLLINGFMSAGISRQTNKAVSVASFDTDYNIKEDTILAVQLSKAIDDKFSVTGQLVGRGNEDYEVDASWVYTTYQASDATYFRLGRIIMPLFHFSEFIEIGYGYNWIRPPAEVYRFPFSTMNAADVNHQFYLGNVETNVQFYMGNIETEFQGLNMEAENLIGLVINSNYNYLDFRLSYHTADVAVPFTPGDGSRLDQVSQGAQGVAAMLSLDPSLANAFIPDPDDASSFLQFSIAFNDDTNLILLEWTAIDVSFATYMDDSAWLFHFARKMGSYTPHFTYATTEGDPESGGVGVLQKALGMEQEASSIILGVKKDISEGIALKFEVQQKNVEMPVGAPDRDAILYGLAIDMVF